MIHIYNLKNYELLSAFGTIGEGPGEFVSYWLIPTQLADFIVEDNDTFRRFGIDKEGAPIHKGAIQPKYVFDIIHSAFINDTLFAIDAGYVAPDLHLVSMDDALPKKTKRIRDPNIKNFYHDPNWGFLHANASRIVYSYNFMKQIDFMDVDFNLIKQVTFNYSHPTHITQESFPHTPLSYGQGYLGKRYFYVLFHGAPWQEYAKNPAYRSYLEVFDLNGNPVVRYLLDGALPTYFVVDEETFTLYGTEDDGAHEDFLLMYRLKGL